MQDETNPAFADAGIAVSQDTPTPSPEGVEGGTQAPATITYTQEDVDKLVNIGRADLGRKLKEATTKASLLEQQAQRAKDLEAELDRIQRERDEAELAAAAKHPDTLQITRQKIQLREENRRLEQEQLNLANQAQQFQADINEAKEYKKLKAAMDISKKYPGVVPEELVAFTDGNPEKMEILARRLTGGKTATQAQPNARPDSGRGEGAREPTQDELEKMDPEQYREYWLKREGYKT